MANEMIEELQLAKQDFLNYISKLRADVRKQFIDWVITQHCNHVENIDECCDMSHEQDHLDVIIEDLRQRLPISGMCSSETMFIPEHGQNSDCDPKTTVVVDSFLYTDDDVDKLCDENRLTRNYCTNCGSKETKPLTFISHSMSVFEIKTIFQDVLPKLITDFSNKIVIDVGSRLGAVLYGANYFSSFDKIIGIEMNDELYCLQNEIINKYKLKNKVQVMHSDINNVLEILKQADVVILNNTFEFFLKKEVQISTWLNLRNNICKPNSIVVTAPSVEESVCLGANNEPILNVSEWLVPLNIDFSNLGVDYCEDELEDLSKLNFYKVK